MGEREVGPRTLLRTATATGGCGYLVAAHTHTSVGDDHWQQRTRRRPMVQLQQQRVLQKQR